MITRPAGAVFAPSELEAALAWLAKHPTATPVMGGTDVMVDVHADRLQAASFLALDRIEALGAVCKSGDALVLGAGVTATRCLERDVASVTPALAQAARSVGSVQIRNRASIGGNLATASPAGDLTVALTALGATVRLASARGCRSVPAVAFATAPRMTVRRDDEIIVDVSVPIRRGSQEFLKVGRRSAMAIALASIALVRDGAAPGVAIGAAGPRVLRATDAEAYLTSGGDDAGTFADLVANAACPVDDHRATASYRRHALRVLARRAFERTRS